MVFESTVVDLLNKFGGQYLENLDSSQLRIGIWGGGSLVLRSQTTSYSNCILFVVFFPINFFPKWSALVFWQWMLAFSGDVKLEGLILKESALVRFYMKRKYGWHNTNYMLEVALWIISIQNWDLECLGKATLEIIFLISKIYVRKLSNSQLDSMTALVLQTISTSHFLGTNN